LQFDIPVMVASAIACLPILFTGQIIARWEGCLFLFYYLAYTAYLILVQSRPILAGTFARLMLYIVIPVTIMILLASFYHHARRQK
jgi:cation:H+ antiporter